MVNFDWYSLTFFLVAMIGILFLFRFGMHKQIGEICFYLVTKAELEFGSGTGELKYATVVTWLYERIPAICRWLFSQKQIDRMIETAVTRMKKYLSDKIIS